MGFEKPTNSSAEPHPFDAILADVETSNKNHSKEVELDGTVCDVCWRDDEPNNWTVYIDGLPFGVSGIDEESLRVTDASSEPYNAVVTESKKASAVAAVQQLLQLDKAD